MARFRALTLTTGAVFLFLLTSGCEETKDGSTGTNGTTVGNTETGTGETGTGTKTELAAPTRSLNRDELIQIVALHNKGLAELENKEWLKADATLSELIRIVPESRAARRNLAIGRTLAVVDRTTPYKRFEAPEAYQKAVASAEEAVAGLINLRGADEDIAIADMLSGQLMVFDDSPKTPRMAEGLAKLTAAAERMKDRPDFWMAIVGAMETNRQYNESPVVIQILRRCSELAPDNLYVLERLVDHQASGLESTNPATKKESMDLRQTLERAIPMLQPMNTSFIKQSRIDIVDQIRKAVAQSAPENPEPLFVPAMYVKNLLLNELAKQIDARSIQRNLLDYCFTNPDEWIEQQIREAGLSTVQSLPATLTGFTPHVLVPDLKGVTDVAVTDFTLDSKDDLLVAREGYIEVYERSAAGEWQKTISSADVGGSEPSVPVGGLTKFITADLDRDFDKVLSDVNDSKVLLDFDGDQKIVADPADKNRWFDADLDLIAWGPEQVVIFRNQLNPDGTRSLQVIPQKASQSGVRDITSADIDADGDLDLVMATGEGVRIWKSLDGTQFEAVESEVAGPAFGLDAIVTADWNRDMAMDVAGVSATGGAGELQNLLHGRFRWQTAPSEQKSDTASQLFIRDVDNNNSWDRIQSGLKGIQVVMTDQGPTGTIRHLKTLRIIDQPSHILLAEDFDNDGNTDLIVAHQDRLTLYRGAADGSFAEQKGLFSSDSWSQINSEQLLNTRAAAADFDLDGDLDVVVINGANGQVSGFMNEGGNQYEWIDVVARAVPKDEQFPHNRVNMHAFGSVLQIRSNTANRDVIIDQPRMHLGLGTTKQIDSIRIVWTDGVPQHINTPEHLRSRIGVLAPQILKGSCPYIYTWTGERFEFFSDCLWAAPLGLVQATGDLAPTREWEYLLVPGEKLAARDGKYFLQFTEELWEAAYLDEVKLVAVDHPVDVDIFTNEKVGSPQMAAHRIHTVRERKVPQSVVDSRGRDLLPGLLTQDGDYVQAFTARRMQGVVDPWFMEFELGELRDPSNVRLVLIGWVFPTDTSLNLAIEQNPQIDPPAGPSIEVLKNGTWETAIPFIGFPSGKTKAMVVDISQVTSQGHTRFRLSSGMELYWDAAFVIDGEHDEETRSHACELEAADLHYRGFSRRVYSDQALFRQGHAPEDYNYQAVTEYPRWAPMRGRFTKYGETTELLTSQDDMMIVMGPGDELTLEFSVPNEEPPKGWKRDFVLYNVGWDKDADLNTIYGQSSEPYPFRGMTRYPFADSDKQPDTPEYHHYMNTYQTREYRLDMLWPLTTGLNLQPINTGPGLQPQSAEQRQ
ncbi:MAG: CRTAC1 family protein [Planctomyces sp.]|nr:CRTAC1 family protein [Planctomyces sp.]